MTTASSVPSGESMGVKNGHFLAGTYVCSQCGYELFSSRSKYAHDSPWPAFTETMHADSVAKHPDPRRPGALKVRTSLLLYPL